MSAQRVFVPGAPLDEHGRMRRQLQDGPQPPQPLRHLTGELRELATRQGLVIAEADGRCTIAHVFTGEVVMFLGRPLAGIELEEAENFLQADETYLWGRRDEQ